jgi:hypothetical protein
MIQRKQTIYLLLGLIAWTLVFLFPTIGFSSETGGAWSLLPRGVRDAETGKVVMKTIPMLILFLVIEHLALISMVSYKKRASQLRMTSLNILLQLFSYGLMAFYVIRVEKMLNADAHLLLLSAMPLLSGIFNYLAYRAIRQDIRLLKSQERLR